MTQLFLGIIAIATMVMAIVQVGFILYGWTLARRVSKALDQLDTELKPMLDNLSAMARDAARASSLAAAQVELVDRLFTDVTNQIDETVSTVQRTVLAPLREGAGIISGIKAALAILREATKRPGAPARSEDEEALFIG